MNEEEQTIIVNELEISVTTPILGTDGMKEFYFRATSNSEEGVVRLMDKAVKDYAMHLRTLNNSPRQ